jgi:carboxyl-terminal processing protease
MQQNRQSNGCCGGRVPLRRRTPGILVSLFLFCSVPSAPLYCAPSSEKEYFEIVKSVDLLGEVYRQVSLNYVDTLDTSKMMYAGIDGMLHSLDPYTVFLDKSDSEELDELTSGQYAGIGVTIASIDGTIFITSVVDGYPAAKAGIRVGDSIAAINGIELRNKSLDDVKTQLKGPLGTSLSLKIERQGAPAFAAGIVREEVRVNTVSYSGIIGETGYIEMKSFGVRSVDELRAAIQGVFRQAGEKHIRLKGIILDLRNNPGGLLNAAVDVSSLFVSKGSEVVSIRGRLKETTKSYVTVTPPVNVSIPLAVLINSQSASAAEIVAGAFQDLDRGVIIGERSYGKGLVQSVITLSYDNTLKLTTAKYYTPSGRLIQKEVPHEQETRKVLPDSHAEKLSTVFYTKRKRKVYGGGGITPDIELTERDASPYLTELRKKGMLFLFASSYRTLHPIMPQLPIDRKALMTSFNEFLHTRKFTYTSAPERQINELKESLKGGQLNIPNELQQAVERLKAQQMAKESEGVAEALEVELLRHYDNHLAKTGELKHDPVVKKAIEVLSDSRQYARILHP